MIYSPVRWNSPLGDVITGFEITWFSSAVQKSVVKIDSSRIRNKPFLYRIYRDKPDTPYSNDL